MDMTTIIDDEGEEIQLPTKWAICDRCRGEGHHSNPAFDGTTTEWWYDGDPDGESLQAYMSGAYDIPCDDCHGSGKVKEVDRDRCTERQLEILRETEIEVAASYMIEYQERMMGA